MFEHEVPQFQHPLFYFRSSRLRNCPYPYNDSFKGKPLPPYRGKGTIGSWSRGFLKNLFTTNIRLNPNEEQITETLDREEKNGIFETHIVVKRCGSYSDLLLHGTALETYFEFGLHHNSRRNNLFVFVELRDRKFVFFLDEGLWPALPKESLSSAQSILTNRFRKDYYTQGLCDVVEHFGRWFRSHRSEHLFKIDSIKP